MDITTIIASGSFAAIIQVVGIYWIKERLKQSIKHEYDRDLERIRKELEFDLDKKKTLYAGKLTQYKKYFALIDSYSQKSRQDLFKGFQEGLIGLIKDPSSENTLKYFQSIFAIQGDMSDKFVMFKTEINGLRLEAGEDLLRMLDQYVERLEKVQDKTAQFMSLMNQNISLLMTDPEAINKRINEFIMAEFQTEGKELMDIQGAIFREMRRELGIV